MSWEANSCSASQEIACLLVNSLLIFRLKFMCSMVQRNFSYAVVSAFLQYYYLIQSGSMLVESHAISQKLMSLDIFNLPNYSSYTMALRLTQPLTEMNTRNLSGGKRRSACEADNLTAICELFVWKIWGHKCLTTLRASTTCYRDSFTFIIIIIILIFQVLSLFSNQAHHDR
jgi:hypothetical protein